MRLLLIDVSNSRTKYALARKGELGRVRQALTLGLDANAVRRMLEPASRCDGVVLCSVVPQVTTLFEAESIRGLIRVNHRMKLNFGFDYPKPEEIGADRLADTAALVADYGAPAIGMDLGTAATIEVVDPEGRFAGGVIAPGPDMMLQALHQKTAQLPATPDAGPIALPAKNTMAAMRAGCYAAYPHLLESLLEQTIAGVAWGKRRFPVVLTGGVAPLVYGLWRRKTILDPHLTLRGLLRLGELNMA